MKDKKSFILYTDQREHFDQLTDEQAGKLVKHLFAYVSDENPEPIDMVTKLSFTSIKSQLKRDLIKYEGKKEQWSKAGKASADARKKKKATKPTDVNKRSNRSTESSVTVNDNVSVNVNVTDNDTKVYTKDVYDCLESCLVYFPEQLQPDNFDTWIDTIDKLHRIDNVPYETILKITRWAREDSFWSTNFLSLTKLRKKNKEGLMYIVVFNEKLKTNGKQTSSQAGVDAIIDSHYNE